MSTSDFGSGRLAPPCVKCEQQASCVVAYIDETAYPYCDDHAMDAIGHTGREYPLEEFYDPDGEGVADFKPADVDEFDIYDPYDDEQLCWISANNVKGTHSYVELEKWC